VEASEGENHNEFGLKRGYINFSKRIAPYISGRITPDITIDREGDGMGDVEMRLKYCFGEFKYPVQEALIAEPAILFGQVYTPFIEYEEKINLYRVEGPHFLDRIGQVSSADFGVTVTGLLGGVMDEDYRKRVNKNHAGRFGSFALGVYNGGGYHALEVNGNKTFQWRVTTRPFPEYLPGLQASFAGALGKGNTSQIPDWRLRAGFISYEHEFFVFTGQYFNGIGDHTGMLINAAGESLSNSGHSLFGEIKLFRKKVSLFGRWDYTQVLDESSISSSQYIAGLAYHVINKTKLVVDYSIKRSELLSFADVQYFEIVLDLSL
jgi:hypothetical protein